MFKNLLILLAVVGVVVYLVHGRFFYTDETVGCNVTLAPSVFMSSWNPIDAIKIMKNADPEQYKVFCENIHTIDIDQSCGGFEGGCYHPGSGDEIFVGPDIKDIALAAAIIEHETCHVLQDKENRPFSELECNDVLYRSYRKFIVL